MIFSRVFFVVRKIYLFAFFVFSLNAHASDVCEHISKNEKHKTKRNNAEIFLINEKNEIDSGPIYIENQNYYYKKNRFVVSVPTKYRIIVFPKKIRLSRPSEGNPEFNIFFKKTKDTCRDTNTYQVIYQFREMQDAFYAKEFVKQLPYEINEELRYPNFEDPDLEDNEFLSPVCRFDCRFVGTFVDGNKK